MKTVGRVSSQSRGENSNLLCLPSFDLLFPHRFTAGGNRVERLAARPAAVAVRYEVRGEGGVQLAGKHPPPVFDEVDVGEDHDAKKEYTWCP